MSKPLESVLYRLQRQGQPSYYPEFDEQMYTLERELLRGYAYPIAVSEEAKLMFRTHIAAQTFVAQRPTSERRKVAKTAVETIQQSDLALPWALDVVDALAEIDTGAMNHRQRQTIRAITIGAGLHHEALIQEQATAAQKIQLGGRETELSYLSLYETPYLRFRWGIISLESLYFTPHSIQPDSYLESLAMLYTYIHSIHQSKKNVHRNPVLRTAVGANTTEVNGPFPLTLQQAGASAALMIQAALDVEEIRIDELPHEIQLIPDISKAIEAYARLQKHIQAIRSRLVETILDPRQKNYVACTEAATELIANPRYAESLTRELGFTKVDNLKMLYRKIRQVSQSGVHPSLYFNLLLTIEELVETKADTGLCTPEDLRLHFGERNHEILDNLWDNLKQLQKKAADKMTSKTQRSFVLEDDDLDLIDILGFPKPQRVLVTIEAHNPYSQVAVVIDWVDEESKESFRLTLSLNSKRKHIVDWSCIADPQDQAVKAYHAGIVQFVSACFQQVASHPVFTRTGQAEQPAAADARSAITPSTQGARAPLVPRADEIYELRKEIRRQAKQRDNQRPMDATDFTEQEEQRVVTLVFDPLHISDLFTVQVDPQTITRVTTGLDRFAQSGREPSKLTDKPVYASRIGEWRVLWERTSGSEYRIISIEPRRNYTRGRLGGY